MRRAGGAVSGAAALTAPFSYFTNCIWNVWLGRIPWRRRRDRDLVEADRVVLSVRFLGLQVELPRLLVGSYRNELLPGSVLREDADRSGRKRPAHRHDVHDLRAVDDRRAVLEQPLHRYGAASLERLAGCRVGTFCTPTRV